MPNPVWLTAYAEQVIDNWITIKSDQPSLVSGDRQLLVSSLETTLLSSNYLMSYAASIAQLFPKDRHLDTKALYAQKHKIIEKGLGHLADSQLPILLLDVRLLLQLSAEIERQPSQHWIEVMEREGIPYFGKSRCPKKLIQQ